MSKLTTGQAARILGIHHRTLQRWFREGLREPEVVVVGNIRHRLYSEEDLERCRAWQRTLQGRRAASTNPQTPAEVDEKEKEDDARNDD